MTLDDNERVQLLVYMDHVKQYYASRVRESRLYVRPDLQANWQQRLDAASAFEKLVEGSST